ncbi:MAG: ArsR family transcriptional regulator [Acidimicrobiales bacterium]
MTRSSRAPASRAPASRAPATTSGSTDGLAPPAIPPGSDRAAPVEPPTVSEHQRSVLYALKRCGEATVETIARSLGITVSGARQHLSGLADEGLVIVTEKPREPGTRGRSSRLYRLAPAAEPLFPKAYGELTNELLDYLSDEDGTLVEILFHKRRDSRIGRARTRLEGKSLAKRVAELAEILTEDGYLADWEKLPGRRFRITEHNCAIRVVAGKHPQACSSEIEFLRAVLPDATVERTSHIGSGASRCAYEITPVARPAA